MTFFDFVHAHFEGLSVLFVLFLAWLWFMWIDR